MMKGNREEYSDPKLVSQLRELARIEQDPAKRTAIMERITEIQGPPSKNDREGSGRLSAQRRSEDATFC
jgi:hypothetical protein